ncbi:FAD-binding-3 domain-containing protein [Fusarium keratoplasticum]|nr:FAD-binding-3 domain-containing protein [Fusarium keratoplasticum]
MKVIIIGAGIGGLVCAIACRREGLSVTVLERTPVLAPVGAGIQIPPNAARVARHLGILEKLGAKSVLLDSIDYLRYENGEVIFKIDGANTILDKFGDIWMVIGRPDYHDVLVNTAREAGVEINLDSEVDTIDFNNTKIRTKRGETFEADVIVGADGLWSNSRNQLLGRASPPAESGDLAYRATISREQLLALDDPSINKLIQEKSAKCWMGPGRHCVFYPLAGGEVFNLVLLRPDNLDKDVRQAPGDIDEMRACFEGWDQRLTRMISCISTVLKWKLCHHEELVTWTKGSVALLGDACHPTLPYQAQGAAMAVEDGAVLGKLLGLLDKSQIHDEKNHIPEILKLYESLPFDAVGEAIQAFEKWQASQTGSSAEKVVLAKL